MSNDFACRNIAGDTISCDDVLRNIYDNKRRNSDFNTNQINVIYATRNNDRDKQQIRNGDTCRNNYSETCDNTSEKYDVGENDVFKINGDTSGNSFLENFSVFLHKPIKVNRLTEHITESESFYNPEVNPTNHDYHTRRKKKTALNRYTIADGGNLTVIYNSTKKLQLTEDLIITNDCLSSVENEKNEQLRAHSSLNQHQENKVENSMKFLVQNYDAFANKIPSDFLGEYDQISDMFIGMATANECRRRRCKRREQRSVSPGNSPESTSNRLSLLRRSNFGKHGQMFKSRSTGNMTNIIEENEDESSIKPFSFTNLCRSPFGLWKR